MLKNQTNQAIALAGLSQAVLLVDQVAKRGYADREALAASIGSTLKIDAEDVLDVYGGLSNLAPGLKQLALQLATPDKVHPMQVRYASTLMFLERQLMARQDMVNTLGAGLRRAAAEAERGQVLDPEVIAILAEAYQATLSNLKPRVLVEGEPMYLSDPDNAQLIRALLLAGIRSVALWRQAGGERWRLLLFRPSLQKETRKLLDSL